MTAYHLAQCNISLLRAPIDDPLIADFVAQLATINGLAEAAPGFVWRLKTPAGDATSIRAFDDERIILNTSVWESIEKLFEFTYRTQHTGVIRSRDDWFERLDYPHVALWWSPIGEYPTPEDCKHRLDYLKMHGPSSYTFNFKMRFPAPTE